MEGGFSSYYTIIEIGTEAFGELVSWIETSPAVARVASIPQFLSISARIPAMRVARKVVPSHSFRRAHSIASMIASIWIVVIVYPVLSSTVFAIVWSFPSVNCMRSVLDFIAVILVLSGAI
jgi:hypothetical protein